MKRNMETFLPLLIVVLAMVVYGLMVSFPSISGSIQQETNQSQSPGKEGLPTVEVFQVRPETFRLDVETYGIVTPEIETELATAVSGRIIWTAPSFHSGGFFKVGEVMAEIEDISYRSAVAKAEAEVATARRTLLENEALAKQAKKDWQELGMNDGAPDLPLHRPQLKEAQAALRSAQAALSLARHELNCTKVRAPYNAIVKAKRAELGQYVSTGSPLADIFLADTAEVRLPITPAETTFLDLPSVGTEKKEASVMPKVVLTSDIGGKQQSWQGDIVRTEAVMDEKNHVFYIVTRVEDPYGIKRRRPAELTMGLFVAARVEGKEMSKLVRLPARMLREDNTILVINPQDKIAHRIVELIRREGDTVIIGKGFQPGDRICATALTGMVEGAQVKPLLAEKTTQKQPILKAAL